MVFERNSAFRLDSLGNRRGEIHLPSTMMLTAVHRAHLQKHEKIHVCQMPGCTAKGGFARVDQLRRHMQTVPHHAKR